MRYIDYIPNKCDYSPIPPLSPFPRWEGGNSAEIGCLQAAKPLVNNQF